MAEQAAKEPTMEEILSSIRRIISEGGEPEVETVDSTLTVASETETSDTSADEAFDVSELLDEVTSTPADNENEHLLSVDELLGDTELDYGELDDLNSMESADLANEELSEDISAEPQVDLDSNYEDISAPVETFVAEEPAPEPFVAPDPAPAPTPSSSAAALSSSGAGSALEGLVSELMKPMIKEWIDSNLPTMVESRVEAEIQQIANKVIAALRE